MQQKLKSYRTRYFFWAFVCLPVIAITGIGLLFGPFSNRIRIVNEGDAILSDILVTIGHKTDAVRDVGPGKSRTIYIGSGVEGSIEITGIVVGTKFRCETGYTTSFTRTFTKLLVNSDNTPSTYFSYSSDDLATEDLASSGECQSSEIWSSENGIPN